LVYLPVRKNSLFAGHDEGAVNWACLASLIETAKIHGIDPQAYLADILAKLVNGWPNARLWVANHELLDDRSGFIQMFGGQNRKMPAIISIRNHVIEPRLRQVKQV